MKKWIGLFVIILVLCSSGCTKGNSDNVDETKYLLDEKYTTDEFLMQFDTPFQYAESLGRIIKQGSVYYIYSYDTKYLYYYDEETESSGKLCGKAECLHDNNSCNAYLNFTMNVQIYDNEIYWLEDGKLLYKMDLTGNNREKVQDLKSAGGSYFNIHRGYIYTSCSSSSIEGAKNVFSLEIIQYKLGEKNDSGKVLFQEKGEQSIRYMMQFYGNKMYLVMDQYQSLTDIEWDRTIMQYHIGSDRWGTVVEKKTPGWIRSMYAADMMLYTVEQKINTADSRVSVRQITYEISNGKEVTSEWIEFEPNKTWSTHILPGYIFMMETAPHTEEGVLRYQLINTDGDIVKERKAEGLQPMYCGADDTGVFVRFMYNEASESGMKTYFKMVRIPYEAELDVEYLVDDVNILR